MSGFSYGLGLGLFSLASALLAYTYVIYPLAIFVLARMAQPRPAGPAWEPTVSFIITAHNEEQDIAAKLENTLRMDYPKDKMEIIVSSDASADSTEDLVRGRADRGVKLISDAQRVGKTAATQRAVRAASGEILVFSDATGLYSPNAVRLLVRSLADPTVGCVSGRVEYHYADSLVARGFRAYQWCVKALRRQESARGILTSISGSIHACRREGFPCIEAHQNYDLLLPLEMARRGLRSVYQNDAISLETARSKSRDEFRARVRAGIRAFSYLSELRPRQWMLHTRLFVWAVVSSKVLRWLTPLWLISLLAGNILLAPHGSIWGWCLLPHAGLYVLAGLAAALPPSRMTRWLSAPLFVGTASAGFLIGLFHFVRGERAASWQSPR